MSKWQCIYALVICRGVPHSHLIASILPLPRLFLPLTPPPSLNTPTTPSTIPSFFLFYPLHLVSHLPHSPLHHLILIKQWITTLPRGTSPSPPLHSLRTTSSLSYRRSSTQIYWLPTSTQYPMTVLIPQRSPT